MYTVLIVDDHKHQVDTMAATLPWDRYDITTIYRAYGGTSAIDIIDAHPVDIMITDIRMPGTSGLELIQYANERGKNVDCILLTGYAEFEYAKKAVEVHAIEYFIKPVRDEVLMEAIGKIVAKRRHERQHHQNYAYAASIVHRNLPLLRENLLLELLQEPESASGGKLDEKLAMYRIPFARGDAVKLLAIKFDPAFYETYSQADMKLFKFAVMNMAEEQFSERFLIWPSQAHQDHLVLLIKPAAEGGETQQGWDAENDALLEELAAKLLANAERYLKRNIGLFISDPVLFPAALHQAYVSVNAMLLKAAKRQSGILSKPTAGTDRELKPLTALYRQPMLIQLMNAGNRDRVNDKLDAIFQELASEHADSPAHTREAYLHLLSAFTYLAHKKGKLLEDLVSPASVRAERTAIHSAKLLDAWSRVILDALFGHEPAKIEDNHRLLVQKVHAFVELNLNKDVTLQSIGDFVYLNAIYLSQIYKDITGENLSDYILRARMEKAKMLLEGTSLRIYEITEQVGYQSPQHFIRRFKSYYGVTPEFYRKS
ncbi:response regulator [Cohnella sp. GCM10012308]|uniref:response regulator n=1 Tax=Cohnella sp. GCM10012308 TaxID=3317329 RepID=UPI00361CAC5E